MKISCQTIKRTREYRAVMITAVVLCSGVLTGCFAPPMANMQSARTLEEGETSIMAYASPMEESETREKIVDQYGFIVSGGGGDQSDWQLRFDRFQFEDGDGYNFTSIGPKIGAVKDRLAFMLPFGVYWGPGVALETLQIHPGVIVTPFSNEYMQLNMAGKVTVPLNQEFNSWGVANVGFGLSNDLDAWALMPEVGFAWDLSGETEPLVSYGVAAVFYFRETDSAAPGDRGW